MNVLCSYKAKWRHKLFNGKAGYYINRDFKSLDELKNQIELIQKDFCPF